MVGSPPENMTTSGSPSARTKASSPGVYLLEGEREAVWLVAGVGEADRAVEVAATIDREDPQAGVLLVVGAEPAVERAALDRFGLGLEGDGAGLVEP